MKTKFFTYFICMMLMVSCGDSGQTPDLPPSGGDTEQPGGNPDNGDKDNPDQPDVPDNPDQPDTPDQPDIPDTPDQPDTPDNPDQPDTPDNPDEPDNPVFPILPEWDPNPQMPDGTMHTFYVASRLFTPEGGEYSCFVIKYEGAQLWHYVEYYFSNFEYEEGYEYLVRAELQNMNQPGADGVDKLYMVKEVISKEKKDSENLPF